MKEDKEKKEEEKLKEELKELLKEEYQKKQKLRLFFKYGLHPNFSIHLLLTILVNVVLLSAINGLTNLGEIKSYGAYFAYITLFSVSEVIVKLLITKLLSLYNYYSIGAIDFSVVLVLFYLIVILPKALIFVFLWQVIVYIVIFMALRFLVSYYIKLYFLRRGKKD